MPMLDIHTISSSGAPVATVARDVTPEEAMRAARLSSAEIAGILDALANPGCDEVVVGERVMVAFSDRFMRDLGVAAFVEAADRRDESAIAAALGLKMGAARQTFDRAKRKLQDAGQLRGLVEAVFALREVRARRADGWDEIEITTHTKITIERS